MSTIAHYDAAMLDNRARATSSGQRMLHDIFASLAQGMREGGCPLSDEQVAFLDAVVEAMNA